MQPYLLWIVVWIESLTLAALLGWRLHASHEERRKDGRHPNWIIEDLENGMAGNGRTMLELEQMLHMVRGWLEYIESQLEAAHGHAEVTRRIFGEVRGRPFDGSDRDRKDE